MDNPAGADLNNLMKDLEDIVQDSQAVENESDSLFLSSEEKDILGEVGNICMGTSATTLSALLGKRVTITTPNVSVCRTAKELGHYQKPFLTVEVSYSEGIKGYNILLIQENDVKVITNILMGGDGNVEPDTEIDELHFSAISEVMNQMVGASSTSLSNLLMRTVNITPPIVKRIVLEEEDLSSLACQNDTIIKISFTIDIEGVLHSELMQLMPFEFGKELAAEMRGSDAKDEPSGVAAADITKQDVEPAPPQQPALAQDVPAARQPITAQTPPAAIKEPLGQQIPPLSAGAPVAQYGYGESPQVGVKFMQYESFDNKGDAVQSGENLNLILDVPLQITVELGKCKKSIRDILSLNMGSIIVLDKLAGEMVDILVNGKLFARGEVVVIDDNYGVRVTDIIAVPQIYSK